jgi:predicted nucleic acid-binding protein
MEAFVLDASVDVSWCFPGEPTEDTRYSREILALLQTSDAIVPEIWAFEVANSIFVSFNKRRRITEQQIVEYLERLKQLPIRVEAYGIWFNVDLEAPARKWNLSPYDAAYLALALLKHIPLATTDGDLKKAAAAEGVGVVRTRSIK